jgi:hypothetical protein
MDIKGGLSCEKDPCVCDIWVIFLQPVIKIYCYIHLNRSMGAEPVAQIVMVLFWSRLSAVGKNWAIPAIYNL